MKYRHAVSPIVAMMLIIVMTVAGAGAVALIYNNFVNTDSTFDTTDATTLSAYTQSDINATLEISKLARMPDASYFSSIDLTVDFNGPEPYIYIFDIDLVVDGIKLDTYAEWSIVDWGDAERTTNQYNQFTGYKQAQGTSVTYKVNLTDSSVIFARLGVKSGFDYEVVVGTEQGIVSAVLKDIQLSTNVFNDVTYKVALLNYKQTLTDPTSVIAKLQTILVDLNGTNKIYFLFNNATDIYDTNNGLNGTYIGETYDIVINAEWAINIDVATEYQKIYELATPMVFLGALDALYNDNKIANSTTYDITGTWYTPDTNSYSDKRYSLISNYTISSAMDPILASIRGISGTFASTLNSLHSIGWVNSSRSDIIRYGIINYDLYYQQKPKKPLILENQYMGGLLALRRQNLTANHREVITLPYEDDIMDDSFRNIIWRNIILTVVLEPERVSPQASVHSNSDTITDWSKVGRKYYFSFVLNFTVVEGDIKDGSLLLDYQIPTVYKIKDGSSYTTTIRVGNQAPITTTITVDRQNHFTLNISSLVTGNIVQNTQISIKFFDIILNKKPSKNCQEWIATFSFERLDSTVDTVDAYSYKKVPLSASDTPICS